MPYFRFPITCFMRNFLLFMRRRAFRLSATVFQDYIFLIFSGRNSVTLCNDFDIFHLRAWIVLKELHNEFCFDDFLVVPHRRRQAFSLAPPNSAPLFSSRIFNFQSRSAGGRSERMRAGSYAKRAAHTRRFPNGSLDCKYRPLHTRFARWSSSEMRAPPVASS